MPSSGKRQMPRRLFRSQAVYAKQMPWRMLLLQVKSKVRLLTNYSCKIPIIWSLATCILFFCLDAISCSVHTDTGTLPSMQQVTCSTFIPSSMNSYFSKSFSFGLTKPSTSDANGGIRTRSWLRNGGGRSTRSAWISFIRSNTEPNKRKGKGVISPNQSFSLNVLIFCSFCPLLTFLLHSGSQPTLDCKRATCFGTSS